MSEQDAVRMLRGVRDRQVVGEALVAAILSLALEAPPPLAEKLEALAVECQALVQSNLSEVTELLSDLASHA